MQAEVNLVASPTQEATVKVRCFVGPLHGLDSRTLCHAANAIQHLLLAALT